MKKQVRIRKALPGETPGYYNKTAKFLKKAAMGMEVAAPSMDSARLNQIYDQVYISLKNDATPDILYNQLINEYGLDESTSVMLIKSAMSKLAEEGYVDPELVEDKAETEEAVDPQIQANEDNERAASDAEQEELAISDGGLYDEEAAQMNQNSALEMTQDEEEGAFKYGGYFEDDGEYPDFEAMNPYEEPSMEQSVMDQYSTPGRTAQEKPFSMEDLIAMTPGTQEIQAFPDLASYLGDYRGSYDSYQPEEYLPKAQFAGAVKKGAKALRNVIPTIKYFDKVSPLTNMSAIRKALPVFTGVGDAMTKIPYLGKKFAPKLETTFTQNRTELWNVLNGATPKTGVFSQSGTYAGGADGSLSADRLMLYQDDVKSIIQNIQSGKSAFSLADISPNAEYDGLVSGVYPMDAKVIAGTDDNGFQFFELKHTFGPNQRLPFGTTPAKAKEVTVKNRFYFNTDPATGEVKVFDQLGNPLSTGAKTKYDITRPLGTTLTRSGKYLTTDAGLLETNTYDKSLTGYEYGFPSKSGDGSRVGLDETTPIYDDEGNIINNETTTSYFDVDRDPQYSVTGQFGTPYPNYMDDLYPTGKGFLGNNMGRLREVSDIAPATLDRLSWKGKIGRGLENFGMSTWVPQMFGLGNPIRTSSANVKEMSLPVYGYRNATLGPDVIDPAKEGSYGSDIKNAINYKYRLGLKTTLIGGGLGYLGYKTYDAFANPCQCTNPLEANYMKPDAFGKCPCGTDVGPSRTLDPTAIPNTELNTPRAIPDSMMFLINRGLEPNEENYWRYRDSLNLDKSKKAFGDDFAKGGITKNQFVKKFTAKFQEGGDAQKSPALGQGKRTDNLTEDVANKKDIFKSKLKDNSNIALTQEIYKNAQSNPQILNMLMQDGPKENLAEDQGMQMAQFGASVDGDVPSWYTGYKGMRAPKEYRKMFRQMNKMMPRGNDISRANLASNMYDRRTMQPPFGGVMTYPDYMNMLLTSQMSNITPGQMAGNPLANWASSVDRNTPVYGGPMTGGPSSQAQADDATMQNIMKNIPFLPSMTPDFIDSPLVGNPQDVEDYFRNKRTPIAGETWDTWYTSDGSTPGFAPDTRTWDGTQWVGPTPTERMQLEGYEQGGFVDMDVENPLVKFIYGGDEAEYYEPYGLPEARFGVDVKGIYDYIDNVQKNNQTNGNCPAGYKWDGTKCVLIQNNTNTQTKCGPGTVWNATYKTCIPVAQVNYNPRVVRGQSGFFNNVLPWNPIAGYAGSWTKQKSLPYYLGNKNPYMGQLPGTPAARYVTKKGILGRPKKWIDIYETSGNGAPIDPLQLEQLMNQRQDKNRNQSNNNQSNKSDKLSKTELIDRELQKDSWNKEHWDDYLADKRNRRIARRNFAFDNPEYRRFWDKGVFKQGQPGEGNYYESTKTKRVKDEKAYGGYMQMGGYNPFALGSGLSTGVGQNMSAFAPHSAQQQFENELFGTGAPSKLPPQQQNPFAFLNTTGTGSYAETANTGHTLGAQGQEIIPQKEPEAPQNEYVGVENKRKDMWNIDPEAGVNVFNAGARGVLGVLDRRQNAKSEREMLLNTTDPMNLYASATEQDRGDWQDFGSKSGMYRYDQQGQDRSSRATFGQYGGYMQEGGFYNPSFEEDEELYMTPEELEQFLAAGGQVEYL